MASSINSCSNLLECVYHWEKKTPDRIWLTQPMGDDHGSVKTWTWAEAVKEARTIASWIKSLDLPDRSHIALCSKNCAYWIIADLAIWMAGHVSIPIYPILTEDIVRYLLEHSESRLLFVGKLDPVWEEMKKGVPSDMPMAAFPLAPEGSGEKWDDILSSHLPLSEPVERNPDELGTIIYTSGSTGRPKGAMICFGAMFDSAKGIAAHNETGPEDRMLSYLPLAHVFERWIVETVSFYTGLQLFFAESLDTFLQDLQRARPTLFISVPRLWLKFQLGVFDKMPEKKLNLLLKIPVINSIIRKKILAGLGLDKVRVAGSGSAPIPKEVLEWYRNLGLDLLEGYAMTENFGYSHCTISGKVRPGYVGPPYPDVRHKISETGEILVKSPGNMTGYFKAPEKTKDTLTQDGYVRTGDLGEIDEMGRLKITGRAKELFKTSKGKYVAPAPIENLVLNHPMVEACLVGGANFPSPYVIVMPSESIRSAIDSGQPDGIGTELAGYLEEVNSRLPAHEHLAFMALVRDEWLTENGFLTPTMKIRRSVIEERYGPLVPGWYEEKKPVVYQ